MIDAYDVLGIPPDADEEAVKKAYHKMSLKYHPDKVQDQKDSTSVTEKFNEIKLAKDILSDKDRRNVYDTFGTDLGEERPEMEVWTIGMGTLLSPMGSFLLMTTISRVALWLIGFRYVSYILIILGIVAAGLYKKDVNIGEVKLQSPEVAPILLHIGLVDGVVILNWIWPLLAEAVGIFYLCSEIVGLQIFLESWKIGAAGGFGALILARIFRGWWFWILVAEVGLAVVTLAALTVAAGIMRLWIDGVQAQRGDKLKEWRLKMRKERQKKEEEIASLKKKLEKADAKK